MKHLETYLQFIDSAGLGLLVAVIAAAIAAVYAAERLS